jgi:hypothetical protein
MLFLNLRPGRVARQQEIALATAAEPAPMKQISVNRNEIANFCDRQQKKGNCGCGPVQDLPSAYFGVPPAEVVELGLEVEI